MISRITTVANKVELGDDIKKYIQAKLGRLDKYMPRHARRSVHIDVKLGRGKDKLGNKYECEVIVHLPRNQLQAKEATLNMFAAVDIVEAKLKNQLLKYKEEHISKLRKQYPGFIGRLRAHLG